MNKAIISNWLQIMYETLSKAEMYLVWIVTLLTEATLKHKDGSNILFVIDDCNFVLRFNSIEYFLIELICVFEIKQKRHHPWPTYIFIINDITIL